MGGGLMQLVAYGAQDIYLTGNPQITFFKVVYRRHTNFSMEAIQQTFSGTAGFGNNVTATISRNGDLVYRMYLEHDATFDDSTVGNVGLVERYGDSLIKTCEIEIGGQRIDKHTSMWNRVYSDLTQFNPSGHFGGTMTTASGGDFAGNGTLYQLMTGNGYGLNSDAASKADNDFAVATGTTVNGFLYTEDTGVTVNKIFLPLNFWFCRNPGLALPLIALQYHEVKIKMTFETLKNLAYGAATDGSGDIAAYTAAGGATQNFNLWVDYIYLDTDERRRFAQVSHEYLIEQLQYSDHTVDTASPTIKLNFNHPVKELIWCSRSDGTEGRCGYLGTTVSAVIGSGQDATAGPVSLDEMAGNWQLKLNGHDRFASRDSKYFTRTQVWQHHTGFGALPTQGAMIDAGDDIADQTQIVASGTIGGDSIAVYSFALKPEEHQPSGTCNFSRIDNAQLVGTSLQTTDAVDSSGTHDLKDINGSTIQMTLTIFAVNYNVLRIMSGMGGLAYSN
tara:strand:- start:604 stop:2115 length:1512 start_codon:yes stop_codon:yes gene_type:complete